MNYLVNVWNPACSMHDVPSGGREQTSHENTGLMKHSRVGCISHGCNRNKCRNIFRSNRNNATTLPIMNLMEGTPEIRIDHNTVIDENFIDQLFEHGLNNVKRTAPYIYLKDNWNN